MGAGAALLVPVDGLGVQNSDVALEPRRPAIELVRPFLASVYFNRVPFLFILKPFDLLF